MILRKMVNPIHDFLLKTLGLKLLPQGEMTENPPARIEIFPENPKIEGMDYDKDKVDEMVLALLWLTTNPEGRAWKGYDWEATNRLHEKGLISDPISKNKSIWLTEEAQQLSRDLFRKHFGLPPS